MPGKAGGTEIIQLRHEIVAELECETTHLNHDEKFVYAACTDMKIRVISKDNWQIEVELGETSSIPLSVHVDDENVYATCERRVYVWSKENWGLTGWFELSYSAITTTLLGDSLFVGAKEGRLVSIKKNSHETSSWQLHKSDITQLWADSEIVFTGTNKDEPRVWKIEPDGAPEEFHIFDKKEKGSYILGTEDYLITGISTSDISLWSRVDWSLVNTLSVSNHGPISSMWSNGIYLVALSNSSDINIWELKSGNHIGGLKINGTKISQIAADKDVMILASSDSVMIIRILQATQSLDLSIDDETRFGQSLLRTSPYDVLEGVLELQVHGDAHLQEGRYHDAVKKYESALQLLIDNTHSLLEVPDDRERLTNELNARLGNSLLRSKIIEVKDLIIRIEQVSDELDMLGRSNESDAELERLWNQILRVIKESRMLVDAQAGDMLAYQLTHEIDTLDEDLSCAKEKLDKYRQKISQAQALIQQIGSEWRLIERKRTSLTKRLEFLTQALETIESRIVASEDDEESEVKQILSSALKEYSKLSGQISRIIAVSDDEHDDEISNREEAMDAIDGLLKLIPKKRDSILAMNTPEEREKELTLLRGALEQALETAKRFKFKEEIRNIRNELNSIEGMGK
ncbi:MAG: hypothetical protein ACTSV2_01270 [Candidatus Thorarchaeota archaeon]